MSETQIGSQEQMYSPAEMFDELDGLVEHKIFDPIYMEGGSGIGKSSIPRQVCQKHGLQLYDVRWGSLTPVDARGVPVPQHDTKETIFYTPDFWPKHEKAVILLDEFNMASTSMMGLGQQLLLDRTFGNYVAPDNVWIWAAGNRKMDKGATNTIPSPVHNRVLHYTVVHSLEAWEFWAYAAGISQEIIGFLKFRTELLHKPTPDGTKAWPSPRTWEMADRRFKAGMSIAPAVGEATSSEFVAHSLLKQKLPDMKAVVEGRGGNIEFPTDEPSLGYAVMSELTFWAIKNWDYFEMALKWMIAKCDDRREMISSFVLDVLRILNRNDRNKNLDYMKRLMKVPEAKQFINQYVEMTTGKAA